MSLDDRTRTWQLIMTGDDLRHITLETQADMARLLDLDPSISHLTLEIGDGRVHVARDWPSDQYEDADRLIDRIATSWRVRDRRPRWQRQTPSPRDNRRMIADRPHPNSFLAKPAADRPPL